MIVTIDEMLHKHNLTRYYLSQKINCNYQSLCRLCNNETKLISFSLLQDICLALNCKPNDILQLED